MDITFFESDPFYPIFSIQGEPELRESRTWELDTPALSQVEPVSPIRVPTSILEPNTTPTITDSPSPPLQVYAQRKPHHKETLQQHLEQIQQSPGSTSKP